MAYENKDYVIPIRTSDDETLFFSKNLLINNCRMVREIEGELNELTIPFPANVISDFLSFLESYNDENILNVCQVADYLDYDLGSSFFLNKQMIINRFIDKISIESKYNRYFFYFYKHLRILKREIPDNLHELFLEMKPLYHEYKLEIDWDDIIQALMTDERLIDYHHSIYEKLNAWKRKIHSLDRDHPDYDKIRKEISDFALSMTLEENHPILLDVHIIY